MSGRQIKVTIDAIGTKPEVEALGFNGVGCESATAPIEAALGGGDVGFDRELKPEWNNDEQQEQVQQW